MTKHRCDAYKECAYWAGFHIESPEGKKMWVCSNCWHGTYKYCGWKPVNNDE